MKRPLDKEYNMTFADRCLRRIYVDLSALPVSVIKTPSATSSD